MVLVWHRCEAPLFVCDKPVWRSWPQVKHYCHMPLTVELTSPWPLNKIRNTLTQCIWHALYCVLLLKAFFLSLSVFIRSFLLVASGKASAYHLLTCLTNPPRTMASRNLEVVCGHTCKFPGLSFSAVQQQISAALWSHISLVYTENLKFTTCKVEALGSCA